ncbi:MAG: hypothetical protein AAFY11_00505, partial [Cyanobacteria bacterium J06641_5]
ERAGHLQEERMNFMLECIRSSNLDPDTVLPLDADELLVTPGQQRLSKLFQSLDEAIIPQIAWLSYVPTEQDDWTEVDPLKRIKSHLRSESKRVIKCVLRKYHVQKSKARLAFGSHQLLDEEDRRLTHVLFVEDCRLAHYPLRSIEQTTSKAITDWLSTLLRSELKPNQGYHKRLLFKYVCQNQPLTYKDVAYLANDYLRKGSGDCVEDSLKPLPYNHLKYSDLARVDTIQRLVSFSEVLEEKLQESRWSQVLH